jgi:hypothetical protein
LRKTVATETQRIAMQLDADRRLAAAAGGVGRYFADAAGLASNVVSDLQSAIVGVCNREIAHLHPPSERLQVTLTRSADRIEVVVSRHAGDGSGTNPEPQGKLAGVDSVQVERQVDVVRTRLTKFVSESASGD